MRKTFLSSTSIVIIAVLILAASVAAEDEATLADEATPVTPYSMPFTLLQIQSEVQESLDDTASMVENATLSLLAAGLTGSEAQEILARVLESSPNLVEVVTFSRDGRILAAECEGCRGAVGADISSQEHIAHVLKYRTPTLSGEFLAVEGYNATALAYPVFSPQGEFLGGISALLKPEEMFAALVGPRLNGTDCSIFVMQIDGRDIYSSDPNQIGNNLLTSALYQPYPGLIAVARRMVDERSGYGTYEFQVNATDNKVVTKEIYWTTAGLYGRDWRLALYRIME
ncbi:MAG: cache domain-containing protein [Methanotrichaceae archaeon]|nr:cache domain-containing protein [Methanotrichaceae archaeon]